VHSTRKEQSKKELLSRVHGAKRNFGSSEQSTRKDFKEHAKDLKNLATKEKLKHLVKQSLNGIKHIANNSKENIKKLNSGINRNIAIKEILKQNNQSIKRNERRYKNR